MKIAVPKEIKTREYRVGITPSGAKLLVAEGNSVMIEDSAGVGVGFSNQDYIDAGAKIVDLDAIYNQSDMIVKVKEPLAEEYSRFKENQILFAYLHLAPDLKQTQGLIKTGCTAVAYETVTDDFGGLPLLRPMSEIAGRMSIQAGAYSLEKIRGGSGTLLSGVVGVEPATVLVIGAGVVGINAARIAMGTGARVYICDVSLRRLAQVDNDFGPRITTIFSNPVNIASLLTRCDLVIGAVLVPGASAPRVVTREMIKKMRSGSAIVDVAIDQGGSVETSKPTTHDNPTFLDEGIVHYCVTNMPGAVARTSTLALTNSTLPFVSQIAKIGKAGIIKDKHLRAGLSVIDGKVVNKAVAETLNIDYHDV